MKKSIKLFLFTFTAVLVLVLGCREDLFIYPEEDYQNYLYMNSEPVGASIFKQGKFTELTTPAWIKDLEPGNHYFTLKLEGYVDTTFRIVFEDSAKKHITVFLRQE